MTESVVIAGISAILSFVASMLGLGGAVLLIPAFLYLPQLFGSPALGVKIVSGMTSLQVMSTSLISVFLHHRRGVVDRRIVLTMAIPIVLSSFVGAIFSRDVDPRGIIVTFALMALAGSVLVVKKKEDIPGYASGTDFRPIPAVTVAFLVGFFGGMVGAPGAFILSPLMMTLLRIPTRITIGSTLGIVLLAAAATSAGKVLAGQVRWDLAAAAIAGSVPGAIAGSSLSHRLNVRTLRVVLAVLIGSVGALMLLQAYGLVPGS